MTSLEAQELRGKRISSLIDLFLFNIEDSLANPKLTFNALKVAQILVRELDPSTQSLDSTSITVKAEAALAEKKIDNAATNYLLSIIPEVVESVNRQEQALLELRQNLEQRQVAINFEIDDILNDHPDLTPEEREVVVDAFFNGAKRRTENTLESERRRSMNK